MVGVRHFPDRAGSHFQERGGWRFVYRDGCGFGGFGWFWHGCGAPDLEKFVKKARSSHQTHQNRALAYLRSPPSCSNSLKKHAPATKPTKPPASLPAFASELLKLVEKKHAQPPNPPKPPASLLALAPELFELVKKAHCSSKARRKLSLLNAKM